MRITLLLLFTFLAFSSAQNFNLSGKQDLKLNFDGQLDNYDLSGAGDAARVDAIVNRRDDYAKKECATNDGCANYPVVSGWEFIFEDGPAIIFCSCQNSRWPVETAVNMLGKVRPFI